METRPSEPSGSTGERPVWTAPVVRRIDIRHTLLAPGSNTDGLGGNQPTT